MIRRAILAAAAVAAPVAWGWYEAGWVRYRTLRVAVPGLAPELEGLRIVHLSDFHLGVPSRGERATRAAVEWASARRPDLVAITGDLVSRPRGEPLLRELLARLPGAYVVLGNHDRSRSRDPFSKAVELGDLDPAILLRNDGRFLQLRGRRVWIAGVDPSSRGREPDLAQDADLRILLSHYPGVLDRIRHGSFEVVLAGHIHDGQICVPYPRGKLRLASLRTKYNRGLYRRSGTTMHVSPGLGTTFVPFRFCARPEATELILESA